MSNPMVESQEWMESGVSRPVSLDRSFFIPVIFTLFAAFFWLLVSMGFALLGAGKIVIPSLLGSWGWLTFGRIGLASFLVFSYGWGMNGGLAYALYLIGKNAQEPFKGSGYFLCSALFWNLAIFIGMMAVLIGDIPSLSWAGWPDFVLFLLLLNYSLMNYWIVKKLIVSGNFLRNLSHSYLLIALLWFPWAVGSLFVFFHWLVIRGVSFASMEWWFNEGFLHLWLAPVGLSMLYDYVEGRNDQRSSSFLGWLGLILFFICSNFASASHLVGAPFPLWIVGLGIAARLLLILGAVAIGIDLLQRLKKRIQTSKQNIFSRYFLIAFYCFLIAIIGDGLIALPPISRLVHFSFVEIAFLVLFIYGFYSFVLIGMAHYLYSNYFRKPWLSETFLKITFWTNMYGISFLFVFLCLGGIIQSVELENAELPFSQVIESVLPYLRGAGMSATLILFSQLTYCFLLLLMSLMPVEKEGIEKNEKNLSRSI
ncbi:cytochrome oxidase [Methylacidiphilum kamchatkense Kam1]|uniref:Cytochrome c oxidase cbb3-type subunit 1 n=1 Tax=Methylacidiphilum kamchatkense Kam1 TaxID=1202785 RepID=A0A0C1UNA1_9BACT|nr:cbb3-type cytochrome c oxidase subunit I [Methylacidiphilum kamchatkense]KIE58074.1 cytochrome oxidase [Methylacidiphilum kamchatkense Kam1]QDQ41613.1 cytochrome c oxidase cbb3-type subunit 1 [Methylacidiphilum kamchatkense Kam1]